MKRALNGLLLFSALTVGLGLASPAAAQTFIPDCSKTVYTLQGANPSQQIRSVTPAQYEAQYKDRGWTVVEVSTLRQCDVSDALAVFTRVARYGLTLLGIIAVGFFVYGGFLLLISSGRADYVTKGKAVLTGTFLGAVVVLISFVIVNTVGQSLGVNRDLAGSYPSCRKEWPQCSAVIQNGCRDPLIGEGTVVRLQQALNAKCSCRLELDGCYGTSTATCVWLFKLENGLPTGDNPAQETATSGLLAAVQSPSTQACGADIDVISPEPQPGPNPPPPTATAGCCVSNDPDSPCVDTEAGYCPLYEPPLDPGSPPRYSYAEGTCDSRPACVRSYRCIDYRQPEASACADLANPNDDCPSTTVKQAGTCLDWPGF